MKELFIDFLNVSLSGGLIIAVILLLRLVFRKAPKALICVLWFLVFARILLPIQFEVTWSVRPEIPVISAESVETVESASQQLDLQIPEIKPGVQNQYQIRTLDYLAIGAIVWAVVAGVMLVYTLVSYLRLKYRVREGVRVADGIYEVSGLDSAFLLGYIVPRIYVPMGLEASAAELVIAHEKAHIRRLDNWLKLLGFVTLALHWFNPLCWIAYILLCRDIEDACDETVIRDLELPDRVTYSEALLACGKRRNVLTACPLAFGEISIRQRIKSVLNYRKPALWVSILAVVAIIFVGVFFMTDPAQKHPQYYKQLMNQLGEPKESVFRELGLAEEDLTDLTSDGYFYVTPLTVEFRGVPFEIWLNFDRGSELLSSFRYVAEYDGLSDESVNATGALGKHLVRVHGKGYQWELREEEEKTYDFSADRVRKGLEDPASGKVFEQWDLTQYASKSARTYLDQIQVSSSWQEAYGDMARRHKMSPHFYLQYRALYYPEEDKTVLMLEYRSGWQPGQYTTVVASNYNWD